MRLQSRWKVEGRKLEYYGIRNKPNTTKNTIKLAACDIAWIANPTMPKNKNQEMLVRDKIVVCDEEYIAVPNSYEEAKFCSKCCANNYMIPGIEFDGSGLCPMCQNASEDSNLVSVIPIKQNIPVNKKGLYDVAVFYTGGKDSSYLLYHFAVEKNLRVLALTWEIPYISANAKKSIDNAKELLKNVSFVNWQVDKKSLAKFYKKLYELQGNHCACPSLAYLLFLPILASYNVPYVVLGNEPAQIKNLYYNKLAPKIAYSYHNSKILNGLYNVGRVLTLKAPINFAQVGYISAVHALLSDSVIKDGLSKNAKMVRNIRVALREIDGFTSTLKSIAKRVDRRGKLPQFVHLHLDDVMENGYDWERVKKLLIREIGWVDSGVENKGLHTSCAIERCKEYSQYKSFRDMESKIIPFSAVELCCAVGSGSISREKALLEIKENLGFSLCEPSECQMMRDFVEENLSPDKNSI